MNKLSIKLGTVFFLIIFGLETFMFFFLHSAIVDSRIEEELLSLQARGNSHRAILEKHFDSQTISHVTLMESEADTDVVITNTAGEILDSSAQTQPLTKYLKSQPSNISRKGRIVEDNWQDEPFIATISPVEVDGQIVGNVFMFQNTESVHSLIERLNEHFLLAGLIAVSLTFIIIVFLSKALTKPLIKMKEATSQISQGDFSVTLPKTGNDELGDLAQSIELLATDLNYLTQERNDFLASISHELRTPLTYIKGYADIVHKRKLSGEEREKYLQIILEETNRLSALIKDLFELAKIDKNSFVIQKRTIDLNDFFKKVEKKFSPAFREKNMSLIVKCPSDLFLEADPSRLEQIVFNLLDNSIKYSPSGTNTIVTVRKKKEAVHIIIKDNGKGIPKDDIPYIFNRFYRVDKARTRALGGSGLGLAIVKELVHAHGGTITVKSIENEGTEFELIFKGAECDENHFTSR
ncbi:two-component sensor histidine kinase [Bacillus canaveralius]|uniref:histidine kinase n=1 Tax=Bacillus canaveralius TaxID=1403243 RepID=A0A2N5GQ18_9BACI|nr:ATP-binding protein [Bacillus canaveralius]PLR84931.1 two-component sensor histidine kinase [Bacillus canaveralius]PLR95833.1 two-component sensor histidine kinase [Bacillus canaveralius]